MKLESSRLVAVLLLLSLPLFMLSTGSCSVFYMNTTQPYDIYWNSTNEYSIYLDYLNPHGVNCPDLRVCYIDDTNIGDIDDNFVIDNFFSGNPNIERAFPDYVSFKRNEYQNGVNDFLLTKFFLVVYKDNSTGDYYVLEQRGTVWKLYGMQLKRTSYMNDDFWNYSVGTPASPYISMIDNQVEYKVYAYKNPSAPAVNSFFNITTYYLSGDDGDLYIVSMLENGVFRGAGGLMVNHNGNYEFGGTIYYNSTSIYDGDNWQYTQNSDFTFASVDTALGNQFSTLVHDSHLYHGLSYEYAYSPSIDYYYIKLFPRIAYSTQEQYRSVSFPSCQDIYIGDTQTDFWYNTTAGYWKRRCEGYVPTGNFTELTCDLKCSAYGNTYETQGKDCYTGLIDNYWNPTVVTGRCSVFDRSDGAGYIFESGTDLSNIQNIRVYSYIAMNTTNATEKFAITGRVGLGSVPNSWQMLYNTQTLQYWSPLHVDYNTVDWKTYYTLPLPDPVCFYGAMNISEYALTPDKARAYINLTEPMIRWTGGVIYIPDYLYPVTDNYYINAEYKYYEIPASTDCDTLSYGSNTGMVIDSGTKRFYIRATWENVTEYNTSCIEYEPVCYPETPEGYYYENVTCVGLSCYAFAQPLCNNNGICDTVYETSVNCPNDCKIPTASETGNALIQGGQSLIGGAVAVVSGIFNIEDDASRGLLWMAGSIIIVALVSGVAGVLIGALSFLGLMLVGTMAVWIPVWVGVLFIIISGFLVAKTITDWIRSG